MGAQAGKLSRPFIKPGPGEEELCKESAGEADEEIEEPRVSKDVRRVLHPLRDLNSIPPVYPVILRQYP
ncbi:hypothetical protein DSECCO2_363370 [anaerobic digester metagenome]